MGEKRFATRLIRDLKRNKTLYLLISLVLVWLLLFCYKPMYGVVIAFQRYRPIKGIAGSDFVGFDNFVRFFKDPYFLRLMRNTLSISGLSILFGFPAPIILALLLNEVRCQWFKKTVQTISYVPHFISIVVVCGLVKSFTQTNGVLNDVLVAFGGERINMLSSKGLFYPIYIISQIWQQIGWDSIIYLAALAGVDQEQYEAARIDGAGRIAQMIHITLPSILPTVSTLLVLRLGSVLSVGYEKILLLYQPLTYEVADVISTYVYRKGIIDGDFSFSTAIGLFNSVVNIIFLLVANKASKKMGQSGLF